MITHDIHDPRRCQLSRQGIVAAEALRLFAAQVPEAGRGSKPVATGAIIEHGHGRHARRCLHDQIDPLQIGSHARHAEIGANQHAAVVLQAQAADRQAIRTRFQLR